MAEAGAGTDIALLLIPAVSSVYNNDESLPLLLNPNQATTAGLRFWSPLTKYFWKDVGRQTRAPGQHFVVDYAISLQLLRFTSALVTVVQVTQMTKTQNHLQM